MCGALMGAVLLVVVQGCDDDKRRNPTSDAGGDDSSTADAASDASASSSSVCEAVATWSSLCPQSGNADGGDDEDGGVDGTLTADNCESLVPWNYVRPELRAGLTTCIDHLSCDQELGECGGEWLFAMAVGPGESPFEVPVFVDCLDFVDECDTLDEDECFGVLLYTEEAQEKAAACFARGCGDNDVSTCVSNPM